MATDHRPSAAGLAQVASSVRPLLPVDRRPTVDEALARAQHGRVRILVLGEAKRGKSTLINTIFGTDLLPTGALPLTSVATVVTVGPALSADVRFLDGRTHPIRMDEVDSLVSQRGNPDNAKGVDRVLITAPCPHLPEGTEVVDTPGTGSVYDANTVESTRARATVDVAVLVVAADPPVSAAEVALVADVMATASAAAVVINKTDLVDPTDVADIVDFTHRAVGRVLGAAVPLFPMTLRGAGSGGIDSLRRWLARRLAEHGERDVVAATARAIRREAIAVVDSLRVQQQLLRQAGHDSVATVAALRDILDHAQTSSATAIDHVRGEARRARHLLDGEHEREVAQALVDARRELGDALPAGPGSPEEESDAARARLNSLAADACRSWSSRVGKELEAAIHGATDRVLTGLQNDLADARRCAERTLHLRLSDVEESPPAPPPRLPRLALGDEVVWRELVTTTIAHHLPVAVRRRRLHHHLIEWAESAVPRPFGRARASLQDWLEATTRDLEHVLAATWDTQLAGLQRGIEEATQHWDRTDTDLTQRQGLLDHHLATLERAVSDLDRLATRVRSAS